MRHYIVILQFTTHNLIPKLVISFSPNVPPNTLPKSNPHLNMVEGEQLDVGNFLLGLCYQW